jgi:hypothetical protein
MVISLWEQQLTICWTIKESFINHTWSSYPCENSSSQSVGESKKASSITHGHRTLVRTAAHKLLDHPRKFQQSHMVKHTLVRTSAHKLLDHQRKFHQCTWSYIPLWEQQLTFCWTIKESFINHTWSSYPCENSSSHSVEQSKKVSSIKSHMTVICINNS